MSNRKKVSAMSNGRPILSVLRRALRLFVPAAALLLSLQSSPAGALEIIDSSGGTIYVEVNKGRLLRLDQVPATVFLANPGIADLQFKTSKLVYIMGKAIGETSLFALDKKDQVLLNRKLVVGYDLDQLNASIEALIPNSAVKASMVNSTLVLDGVVGTPAEAEQVRALAATFGGGIFNRVKVAMPNQINLKVTFAEVNRTVLKNFYVDNIITGGPFSASSNFGVPGGSSVSFVKTLGNVTVDTLVVALESEGLATVLAQPSLTTLSGKAASFLAGGEFPFASTDANGNPVTVFKAFGVSLNFTPVLLDQNRISLHVSPEVSSPGNAGVTGIPGINTRRAETTVELGDGESLVLAGLLQRDTTENLSKVPGFGDIPILGALFRSEDFTDRQTELLIIVTPYIVRPTKDRIELPTDGFHPPNDFERIVWGGMYHESSGMPAQRTASGGGQRLVGSPGFKIE